MLLLVVTSLEQFSDAGGRQGCLQFCSIFDYAMDYCDGGSAVDILDASTPSRTPRAHGARSEISSRAGALLCVLALLVQLALAVEHTWEVSIEASAASAALASQQPSTGPGDTRALFKAVTVQRRTSHDPLLCPVCQLLSQAKNGIASHGPGVFLLQTSFTFLLGSTFHGSGIDLAASVPRAPPYFL